MAHTIAEVLRTATLLGRVEALGWLTFYEIPIATLDEELLIEDAIWDEWRECCVVAPERQRAKNISGEA